MRKIHFAAALVMGLGLSLLSAQAQPAATKEISLLWPGGGQDAVKALIPGFEAKTGYKVKFTAGSGAGTRKQIAAGEAFDVAVLQTPLEEVLASGNVVTKSQKMVGGLAVGFAIKKGAPKPDVSTPDAVKKLLLSVKSLSYPNPATGAVGVSFSATLQKLGLSDQLTAKTKIEKNVSGSAQDAADGTADIGVVFLSEVENPNVDLVGPLPASISPIVKLVAFVTTNAKDPVAAQALVDYLASPPATAAFVAERMAPPEK